MPSYKFKNLLSVKIMSTPNNFKSNSHRSSYDYDLKGMTRTKGVQFRWKCPDGITFNVFEDRTSEIDPLIFSNIKNGTITRCLTSDEADGIYIADPTGANSDFTIEVEII